MDYAILGMAFAFALYLAQQLSTIKTELKIINEHGRTNANNLYRIRTQLGPEPGAPPPVYEMIVTTTTQ